MKRLYANKLVQEFIHEASGNALHCFVIGGKLIHSIESTVVATGALALDDAGVDNPTERRALLLEMLTIPTFYGIEITTGKYLSGSLSQDIERLLGRF